ncbi:hypothetical protein GP644_23860, partial [Parasedimentitalea maritima]
MIETHAEHPLEALEQRTATLLDGLREGRRRERQLSSEHQRMADERQRLMEECERLASERERLSAELNAELTAARERQRELESQLG